MFVVDRKNPLSVKDVYLEIFKNGYAEINFVKFLGGGLHYYDKEFIGVKIFKDLFPNISLIVNVGNTHIEFINKVGVHKHSIIDSIVKACEHLEDNKSYKPIFDLICGFMYEFIDSVLYNLYDAYLSTDGEFLMSAYDDKLILNEDSKCEIVIEKNEYDTTQLATAFMLLKNGSPDLIKEIIE